MATASVPVSGRTTRCDLKSLLMGLISLLLLLGQSTVHSQGGISFSAGAGFTKTYTSPEGESFSESANAGIGFQWRSADDMGCPCANCPDRCSATCGEALPPECISMKCYTGYGTCQDPIPGLESLILSNFNNASMVEEASSRIAGGREVKAGTYPFFVQYGGCGGSLIYPDVVLTAGHCLDDKVAVVTVGAIERDKLHTKGAEVRWIDHWVMHPRYEENDDGDIYHDFLLLFLQKPSTHTPIEVNLGNRDLPGSKQKLKVIGMGDSKKDPLNEACASDSKLREVTMYSSSYSECKAEFKISGKYQFCMNSKSNKDACEGDSGGPVFFKTTKKKWLQVGIVSYGPERSASGIPSVYGLTWYLGDWIIANVCAYSKVVDCSKT
uniref:Peptidase S1 domain-containing protein n=1 Tax=Cyclophora tenuis TaxID=216820 RepID=A0A7S1CZT3_CYCTE|mmetsp:Transcript_14279/g.24247  ORF Transcript_14279/g.24247 Transcript_14279/m.24247 type:complete len:382 (+) Transcript_14279:117-1262(+)|eukprot:CAMPEP_0116546358 /NCGR_PEP_ID=MMETSP0397-20121206/3186_1 /TAXON_ID=216820 /ORGANISM="Cyclophora tenuis, Strain ECT3854" /LENGTH=381 /DNA_ID=CAMNT_0004070787 /DNA_START=23 /DNA_END=1168 /DNA_ORIENTATION=-